MKHLEGTTVKKPIRLIGTLLATLSIAFLSTGCTEEDFNKIIETAPSKSAPAEQVDGIITEPGTAPTGSALTALESIPVAEDGGALKYNREDLYGGWMVSPTAGGECDARQEAYKRDMVDITWDRDCVVDSGVLEKDPYTGERIVYQKGRGADVDIDHIVPLEDTCLHGLCVSDDPEAQQSVREAIANDPYNILTVDSSANRQKGAKSLDEWLAMENPQIQDSALCDYAAHVVGIKGKYSLTMTQGEYNTIQDTLESCGDPDVPVDTGKW